MPSAQHSAWHQGSMPNQSNAVPWNYSLGSLFGDIGPTDIKSVLKLALPSSGQEPASSPPGPHVGQFQ